MAPAGATKDGTASRDRESIYKKISVNTINNKDNNCLFRALTIPMHSSHAKIDDIKKGRKIQDELAKELCVNVCGMEMR